MKAGLQRASLATKRSFMSSQGQWNHEAQGDMKRLTFQKGNCEGVQSILEEAKDCGAVTEVEM